uniref:Uncharacterized protein n=1 Tax=Picea glauca TaxID=3330 RepID=A0A101M492_PICGL|nr:hypothetical protein ABT39_MTgene650 [Picea glauca]QHR87020.1 hypothetical protein Q903MT_gene1029 [Picea sitchensis]
MTMKQLHSLPIGRENYLMEPSRIEHLRRAGCSHFSHSGWTSTMIEFNSWKTVLLVPKRITQALLLQTERLLLSFFQLTTY